MRITTSRLKFAAAVIASASLAACGGGGGGSSGGGAAPPISPAPPTGPQTVTKNYTIVVTELGTAGVSSGAGIEIDTSDLTSSGTVVVTE